MSTFRRGRIDADDRVQSAVGDPRCAVRPHDHAVRRGSVAKRDLVDRRPSRGRDAPASRPVGRCTRHRRPRPGRRHGGANRMGRRTRGRPGRPAMRRPGSTAPTGWRPAAEAVAGGCGRQARRRRWRGGAPRTARRPQPRPEAALTPGAPVPPGRIVAKRPSRASVCRTVAVCAVSDSGSQAAWRRDGCTVKCPAIEATPVPRSRVSGRRRSVHASDPPAFDRIVRLDDRRRAARLPRGGLGCGVPVLPRRGARDRARLDGRGPRRRRRRRPRGVHRTLRVAGVSRSAARLPRSSVRRSRRSPSPCWPSQH